MLKLIIVDDERFIRETISTIIDWKHYDIEIVGLCENGLEAYDMILDESPDLVLTDIRMPGMDGLDLIKNVSETNLSTQFIILSGYGEFEYAKKAMQYGVKHYLLKPCNESQIIDCIKDVTKDYYQNYLSFYTEKTQFQASDRILHNVMFSIIHDTIYQSISYDETFLTYEPYLDFHFTPYRLFKVFYLEFESLNEFLSKLKSYCPTKLKNITIYGIYITNTLLLYYKDLSVNYKDVTAILSSIKPNEQHVDIEITTEQFNNLNTLLRIILEKVKRFSMIYYINNYHIISNFNYNYVLAVVDKKFQSIINGQSEDIHELIEFLYGINDLKFLIQIASSILLKITTNDPTTSTVQLTESLILINKENDINELKKTLTDLLLKDLCSKKPASSFCSMTQQVCDYVNQNINKPDLTLKFIAEQYLYMNTDYVSKKFQKDTGCKFSTYLTNIRIEKAKEFLLEDHTGKIQVVAEMVGCGNNPYYFSQLFKKKTGMTPSAYIAKIHGTSNISV